MALVKHYGHKKHNLSRFHSVSGKHCLNNRLAPANLGYAHPVW